MLAHDEADAKLPPHPPCAVCGTPTTWVVWEQRLCGPCVTAWEEAPALQFIRTGGYELNDTAPVATARWVALMRQERAA